MYYDFMRISIRIDSEHLKLADYCHEWSHRNQPIDGINIYM